MSEQNFPRWLDDAKLTRDEQGRLHLSVHKPEVASGFFEALAEVAQQSRILSLQRRYCGFFEQVGVKASKLHE